MIAQFAKCVFRRGMEMNMVVPVLLFLLGFVALIKGGDWFVDGAVGIAHR